MHDGQGRGGLVEKVGAHSGSDTAGFDKCVAKRSEASATIARAFTLALNGSAELAELLMSGTVDASAVRPDGMYRGWSLLHAAASKGHQAGVELLLKHGARSDACNAQGKSSSQIAEIKGFTELAQLIDAASTLPHTTRVDGVLNPSIEASSHMGSGDNEDLLDALPGCAVEQNLIKQSQADALTDSVDSGANDEQSLIAEWRTRLSIDEPSGASGGRSAKSDIGCQPSTCIVHSGQTQGFSNTLSESVQTVVPPSSLVCNDSSGASSCGVQIGPPKDGCRVEPSVQSHDEVELPAPIGFATAMCTEEEARDRERCLELSALEVLSGTESFRRPQADLTKVVKKYQRPAAGAPPPCPSTLRPLPVLERTVDYLLQTWSVRQEVPLMSRYVFLSDRLRAVQQDMTVQRIHSPPIMARIVRFHLLSEVEFHKVPNATAAGFSAVQNRSLLCNALITALETPRDELPSLPLHVELLSYFVLLHADEPSTVVTQLSCAPSAVLDHVAVRRALAVLGAYGRSDGVDISHVRVRREPSQLRLDSQC